MNVRFLIVTVLLAISGCAVRVLNHDQDQIRAALLDLYTNQIMDNLIRAHNGMPIIQIDYTNAQGTVTVKDSGMLSASRSTTHAAITTVMKSVMGSLSGEATNQVTVVGTPVTTHNEVYNAYLEFLSLPGSLMVSDCPPPPEAVHICRCQCDRYYWVPKEYAQQFFRLSLLTTAERGQALLPPDEFYAVTIQKIASPPAKGPANTYFVTLSLDKPIPNDIGYFVFSDAKSKQPEAPSPTKQSGNADQSPGNKKPEKLPDGSKKDKPATASSNKPSLLDIEYSFSNVASIGVEPAAETVKQIVVRVPVEDYEQFKTLLPRQAKVYLTHNRPKAPSMEDLLERANFQLQQIQFNQLREGAGP